jgi:hypothetical protein
VTRGDIGPDGIPTDADGTPLWDRATWGTRGPPWRDELIRASRGEAPAAPPATAAGGGIPTGERKGARDTIDRMTARIMKYTPGCDEKTARALAGDAAARYDRRHGR